MIDTYAKQKQMTVTQKAYLPAPKTFMVVSGRNYIRVDCTPSVGGKMIFHFVETEQPCL